MCVIAHNEISNKILSIYMYLRFIIALYRTQDDIFLREISCVTFERKRNVKKNAFFYLNYTKVSLK